MPQQRKSHQNDNWAAGSPEQAINFHSLSPEITMPPEFNFRLNGQPVPMIFIDRERVNGKLTGRRHIGVWIEGIGRFTIDDDSNLWADTFPNCVLEYRNETEREKGDPFERQMGDNQGWQQVTPDELMAVLQCAGVIDCR